MAGRAAILGAGVIGGGWAARFLLNGWDVAMFDPSEASRARLQRVVDQARLSLPALYDRALPAEGRLRVAASLADAVAGADWVQESVPERLDLKQGVLAEIGAAAGLDAIIASSTSGFTPGELCAQGARAIVAHPFNPVYLLPLVELVGDPTACGKAAGVLRSIGMYPLTVRAEIPAHIADRLLEAVWREALWLVKDGIATTAEIDEAIRMGFGLRWAQMGLFETYRIAGGEAGMAHFLAQFGPALTWPWSRLTDVPDLDEALVRLIAGQSDAQSGDRSVADLEALRDRSLVGLLRALRAEGHAAGAVIAAHEARLPDPEPAALPVTVDRIVPPTWTDQNGHMNEARYLEAGAQATDRFLEMIGAGPDYIDTGFSWFTVESHLRHLAETREGDRLAITTQVLQGQGKKMHLFHVLRRGDGVEVATMETLLLHVDLATRRSSEPTVPIAMALARYGTAHEKAPRPEGAGRFVGQR